MADEAKLSKTVEELVEKILVLEPSRKTLSKAGQELVSHYSWDEMAKQTLAHY